VTLSVPDWKATSEKRLPWATTVAVVLLLIFAANQFATEWTMFRSSYLDPSAGDFPHYYLAAKIAGTPGQHRLYYSAQSAKEAMYEKIDPNTEWGQLARQNGIPDTLYSVLPQLWQHS
jgi:hypothetical protein